MAEAPRIGPGVKLGRFKFGDLHRGRRLAHLEGEELEDRLALAALRVLAARRRGEWGENLPRADRALRRLAGVTGVGAAMTPEEREEVGIP